MVDVGKQSKDIKEYEDRVLEILNLWGETMTQDMNGILSSPEYIKYKDSSPVLMSPRI